MVLCYYKPIRIVQSEEMETNFGMTTEDRSEFAMSPHYFTSDLRNSIYSLFL